ncbi:MAG: hypothetical protein LDL33_04395 [Desulfomonile sp.]|nr:hypothetical protein [Desulfomonile sp.]
MTGRGLFTPSDLVTITRAAFLAEKLTADHFSLADDEWKRNPYTVLTRKEVSDSFYQHDVFAHVVCRVPEPMRQTRTGLCEDFAIVLQDPAILRALLRNTSRDLWTLALFILTHELIHIVRFRKFGVDFFASTKDRDEEERVVYDITARILRGVSNTNELIELYRPFSGTDVYQITV